MPDGSKGFSLLILITAEFTPHPARLRLHADRRRRPARRSTASSNVEAADATGAHRRDRTACSSPRTSSPTHRASSATSAVFPPRRGRFLLGPMAKLGWGTPTLHHASVGVIIEMPRSTSRFSACSRSRCRTRRPTLLRLQVELRRADRRRHKLLASTRSLFDSPRPVHHARRRLRRCSAELGRPRNFVVERRRVPPRYTPPPLRSRPAAAAPCSLLNEVVRADPRRERTSPSRRTRCSSAPGRALLRARASSTSRGTSASTPSSSSTRSSSASSFRSRSR